MRRKRRRLQTDVELNLAAMLDMAFQLLAFFILTFRPSALEGQIMLHLPPAQPITKIPEGQAPGMDAQNTNALQGLDTVIITVIASPNGQIEGLSVGDVSISNVSALGPRLKSLFGDPQLGFDQVLIQAGSNLSYQSLMDVVDVCTSQKLRSGERLTKLGFVEVSAP